MLNALQRGLQLLLAELDRPTVAAAIQEIRVYEGNRVEIDYLFPEDYRALLEG